MTHDRTECREAYKKAKRNLGMVADGPFPAIDEAWFRMFMEGWQARAALQPVDEKALQALAQDYAARTGMETTKPPGGFHLAHPNDIAKAMLVFFKEAIRLYLRSQPVMADAPPREDGGLTDRPVSHPPTSAADQSLVEKLEQDMEIIVGSETPQDWIDGYFHAKDEAIAIVRQHQAAQPIDTNSPVCKQSSDECIQPSHPSAEVMDEIEPRDNGHAQSCHCDECCADDKAALQSIGTAEA